MAIIAIAATTINDFCSPLFLVNKSTPFQPIWISMMLKDGYISCN